MILEKFVNAQYQQREQNHRRSECTLRVCRFDRPSGECVAERTKNDLLSAEPDVSGKRHEGNARQVLAHYDHDAVSDIDLIYRECDHNVCERIQKPALEQHPDIVAQAEIPRPETKTIPRCHFGDGLFDLNINRVLLRPSINITLPVHKQSTSEVQVLNIRACRDHRKQYSVYCKISEERILLIQSLFC